MMKLWAFLGLLVELRNKHGLNKQGKHISSLGIWGTEMDDYIRDEYWILMMRLQLAVMILIHGCFDSRPNLFEKHTQIEDQESLPEMAIWNLPGCCSFGPKIVARPSPFPPFPPSSLSDLIYICDFVPNAGFGFHQRHPAGSTTRMGPWS